MQFSELNDTAWLTRYNFLADHVTFVGVTGYFKTSIDLSQIEPGILYQFVTDAIAELIGNYHENYINT